MFEQEPKRQEISEIRTGNYTLKLIKPALYANKSRRIMSRRDEFY